jgi:transcriptional regulator with GAF, ATPase, and Fis domain
LVNASAPKFGAHSFAGGMMAWPTKPWRELWGDLCSAAFQLATRRGLLILAGTLVCLYAAVVLIYVQSLPDLGLRSSFDPILKDVPHRFKAGPGGEQAQPGDRVVKIGDKPISTWPDLLGAPHYLAKRLAAGPLPSWARQVPGEDEPEVEVHFARDVPGRAVTFSGWCVLGRLPLEELAPAVLWFLLKMMLFLVGALVLWKRPTDQAAAQFFCVCIVTVGAFMGGYHWAYIANQPALLLVFMGCSVLLPAASLHFYLLFPRPKQFFRRRPTATLTAVYGPPLLFLAALIIMYFRARWLFRGDASPADVSAALDMLRITICVYLGVAALWYLGSVTALLHSYRSTADLTERNQVKWILFGATLALAPMGYSLYLAVFDPERFGAGGATWPMFGASVCLTAAFAVSITRYRLMELDKIISSGFGYFLISFMAGLIYFALVFIGTLVVSGQVLTAPSLSQALAVSTTALILMVALDLARGRIRKALDRRLNRERHHLDRTLRRMGRAIEQLVDPPTLAQRLLQASAELLGVPRGAVYLRHGDPPLYRLAGSLGPPPPLTDLPPGSPLVEALHRDGSVVARLRPGATPSAAQRQVQFLGGEVAHAMAHEDQLLALLVLGPKERSPYQTDDLDLLAGFAQVAVPALESAEGHRKIELLNRDLQAKLEKISEQQRRILVLQSQLRQHTGEAPAQATQPSGGGTRAVPKPAPGGIVGSSPAVRELLHLVGKVAGTDAVVLIRGESGTGKEVLARAIHETSPRAARPYVKVHCAALSTNLLESELFGHVKGAFTTAHRDKVGRFELANGGTLLLDEIGDISLEVQTKLLRVLQEMTIERVGSSEPVKVDVRILAATHQDLPALIRQGRFREDLYYRLNVFPIVVPPLRQRGEDIPELALHFLRQSAQRCHKDVVNLDDDTLLVLKAYWWPGNIRQLENVMERAVVIAEGPVVSVHELPPELVRAVDEAPANDGQEGNDERFLPLLRPSPEGERRTRDLRDREQLIQALTAAGGNKAEAARALGLARSTLLSRLKKYGLS